MRDWLLDHEPAGAPSWQPPEPKEGEEELDVRIAAMQDFEAGSTEHFLGDLLGYWRRERRIVSMNTFLLGTEPAATRRESTSVFDAPTVVAVEERVGVNDKILNGKRYTLTYPPQATPLDLDDKKKVVQVVDEKSWLFFKVVEHDRGARRLVVETTNDDAPPPTGAPLVEYDDVRETPKDAAVHDVADQFIAGDPPMLAERLLQAAAPSFATGVGPVDGVFTSDLDAIRAWITQIDGQVVPIQGPPGTGKTYSGSRLIKHLVDSGKRVGIVAQSHSAIDNLVKAVAECYESSGEIGRLRLGRKTEKDAMHEAVTCINDNDKIGAGEFDIVAGTSWFFTSKAMRANPVDVLVVDEAGQLGLIDLVACSVSAGSMLLLGDPQQLPQVSQATHPNGSGASCLGHLLGERAIVTDDRGVLLETTWRMHPDVCGFISDTFYEGSLRTHGSCDVQNTSAGTGLRWIEVDSEGCSTESLPEAEAIRDEILRLLDGGTWTRRADQADDASELVTTSLTAEDVLVVVPYNDQRQLVGKVLTDAGFGGVQVGTVDKFQGREAPIVFFSMTSSTAADMPRGLDFLFSRNRVNVAISRARCLAYLVCTSELLDADASDIDGMHMISAVAELVDRAAS
ncbi:MAG: AAA domain-containing protein [Actinomycetota bacterium]